MPIVLCARATLGWLLALCLVGCTGFGPSTMRYQQSDYAAALADAGKRQALLNILKLRYGDVPSFVRVNQILAGYSLQGTFSAGTEILTGGSLRLDKNANVGIGGTFTNNPTITYSPVTGAEFARTFLAPLPPADLFGLMLSGVPPELALGLGLHSIGGFDNERVAPGSQTAADPRFGAALGLLIELQRAGRLKVQFAVKGDDRVVSVGFGRGDGPDAPERRLRRLLALRDGLETFEVVYALAAVRPGQIPIRTRSLVEVLGQLAADIDVPADDLAAGRTYPTPPRDPAAAVFPQIVVRHGQFEPKDPFVAASYDGDWFWIDNDDLATKRVFSFVMLLLSLSESSRPGQAPLITIPAG